MMDKVKKRRRGILSVNFSHALFSLSFTFGYAGLGCSTQSPVRHFICELKTTSHISAPNLRKNLIPH